MYKIIDNFIPLSFQNTLSNIFLDKKLGWNFNEKTLDYSYSEETLNRDTFQFVHSITDDNGVGTSDIFLYTSPLIYFLEQSQNIKVNKILRFKSNLLVKCDSDSIIHPPHIDSNISNHMSLVYYVHDCDGDTILYDCTYDEGKEKFDPEKPLREKSKIIASVTPKKGRALFFNSNLFHSSSTPSINSKRVVINLVLDISKEDGQ